MSELNRINDLFRMGILPLEFDFSKPEAQEYDMAKLKYNTFYRTPEYHLSKFAPGFMEIPGAREIIQHMCDNDKSPLEQLNEIKNESNIYDEQQANDEEYSVCRHTENIIKDSSESS